MFAVIEKECDILAVIDSGFYDILFAQSHINQSLSVFEHKLLTDAQNYLLDEQTLEKHVSMLPSKLTRLIETINNPGIDYIKVVNDLCEDGDVCRGIIVIANSDMYNSRGEEVTTIGQATALIGLVSVAYVAAKVLMSHVTRTKSSYFDDFSKAIEKHNTQTALACRDLAHQQGFNPFCCHLLGLINNVGLVYCFNSLSSKVNETALTERPNPFIYLSVCQQMAKQLTVTIAQRWQLPDMMVKALEQQQFPEQSGLGKMLFQADLLSKSSLLVSHQKIERDAVIELLKPFDLPGDYVCGFLDM